MQIFSFSPFGYEGSLVSVEVDLRRGIPAVDMVGLADGAVKESRERMRSAIRNSGYDFPPERVLISLSPADLRKEGAGFDLAIALAVLHVKEHMAKKEAAFSVSRTGGVLAGGVLAGGVLAGGVLAGGALAGGDTRAYGDDSRAGDDDTDAYDDDSRAGGDDTGAYDDDMWRTTALTPGDDAVLVMGELELNGKVRPVRGVHAAVSTANAAGIRLCIVPTANCDEAREVPGMKVFGAENLTEAFEALTNENFFTPKLQPAVIQHDQFLPKGAVAVGGIPFGPVETGFEFGEVNGQPFLIRGLQIAAAGKHNVLAYGPPGCGKTLALQRFSVLLPLLTVEEAQPVTRIYSIAGLLPPGEPLMRTPPFRMPHQTATIEGMCGGGTHLCPGEISLAHNGVLFLDEAAEFPVVRSADAPRAARMRFGDIESCRQVDDFSCSVPIAHGYKSVPVRQLRFGGKICLCSAHSVEQYWKKFSAPLLDRIDIRVQVENHASPSSQTPLTTEQLRLPIARAVLIQRKRQGKYNARLTPSEIKEYCPYDDEAHAILDSAAEHYCFSPRAVAGCIKLARTVADMEGKEIIDGICMEEAVKYRRTEGGLEIGFGMM